MTMLNWDSGNAGDTVIVERREAGSRVSAYHGVACVHECGGQVDPGCGLCGAQGRPCCKVRLLHIHPTPDSIQHIVPCCVNDAQCTDDFWDGRESFRSAVFEQVLWMERR